jgi:hydrogenase maturation protease
MNTLIIGVGNPWRLDDGIGPKIIAELNKQPHANFDLRDGGTDALALIDEIEKYTSVIIIDAVNMNAPAGTVRVFTPEQAKIQISSDALTTHGFGLAEMLVMLEKLAIKTKIKIIGIQPQSIDFGEKLSTVIADQIKSIVDLVLKSSLEK